MSMHENERVAREVFEALNTKDVERGAMVLSEHCEIVDVPFGEVYRGPDGWREQYHLWMSAFPDAKLQITELIATDQRVVVEYTATATHGGALKTPAGEAAPTGRHVTMRLCDVIELQDGKIARVRSYFDSASLMRQLGLMPESTAQA